MNKLRRFAICLTALSALGLSTASVQAGENRYVKVINYASSPIRYFYAPNVDHDGWGPDLLGWDQINTGYYIVFNVDDGTGHCLFDFKAVLADGRTATRRNMNVCTEESWTITN